MFIVIYTNRRQIKLKSYFIGHVTATEYIPTKRVTLAVFGPTIYLSPCHCAVTKYTLFYLQQECIKLMPPTMLQRIVGFCIFDVCHIQEEIDCLHAEALALICLNDFGISLEEWRSQMNCSKCSQSSLCHRTAGYAIGLKVSSLRLMNVVYSTLHNSLQAGSTW